MVWIYKVLFKGKFIIFFLIYIILLNILFKDYVIIYCFKYGGDIIFNRKKV